MLDYSKGFNIIAAGSLKSIKGDKHVDGSREVREKVVKILCFWP